MQIIALPIVLLTTADDELVLLHSDLELLAREPGYGQGDAQAVRLALGARQALDIVRRIAVAGGARDAIERSLDRLEPQQKGGIQGRRTRHLEAPQAPRSATPVMARRTNEDMGDPAPRSSPAEPAARV